MIAKLQVFPSKFPGSLGSLFVCFCEFQSRESALQHPRDYCVHLCMYPTVPYLGK